MRKVTTTVLASALATAPLAAQATFQRASQPVADGSELAGNANLFFIAGIVAVAAGIILLQEDEEGVPVSA